VNAFSSLTWLLESKFIETFMHVIMFPMQNQLLEPVWNCVENKKISIEIASFSSFPHEAVLNSVRAKSAVSIFFYQTNNLFP
jgi:hypothetical protein